MPDPALARQVARLWWVVAPLVLVSGPLYHIASETEAALVLLFLVGVVLFVADEALVNDPDTWRSMVGRDISGVVHATMRALVWLQCVGMMALLNAGLGWQGVVLLCAATAATFLATLFDAVDPMKNAMFGLYAIIMVILIMPSAPTM